MAVAKALPGPKTGAGCGRGLPTVPLGAASPRSQLICLGPRPGSQTPGSHESNMCFLFQITLQKCRHSVDSGNVTDNGFFQLYLESASNIDFRCKLKMLYRKWTHVNVLLNVVNRLRHVLLNRLFLWC